jgi:hypothetical protein
MMTLVHTRFIVHSTTNNKQKTKKKGEKFQRVRENRTPNAKSKIRFSSGNPKGMV